MAVVNLLACETRLPSPDGTAYPTRSAALAQCAEDLIRLASAVYHIDLTRSHPLSVNELAAAFAAFRWGALLRAHRTSVMEGLRERR